MEFTHAFYEALPPEAAAIRQAVFVEEQGFQEEFDAIDRHACLLYTVSRWARCVPLRKTAAPAGILAGWR